MPGAARLGDNAQVKADSHGCPACPHPGVGPIVAGSPDVFINKLNAARVDDPGVHAVCCGPNTYEIVKGSPTVYVNKKPLARLNDKTKHCGGDGPIIAGSSDVLIDDGASAEGLGSYVINALKILLEKAMESKKGEEEKASDSNAGKKKGAPGSQDLAKDGQADKPQGSISRVGFNLAKALNGQEVELQIDCRDPKGSLKIEIWAMSADRTQDKVVSKSDAQAAANVKKKVKLDIPADAAGGNECFFYAVVKDANGGEKRSDPIFVDRTPLRFSGAASGSANRPLRKELAGSGGKSSSGSSGAASGGSDAGSGGAGGASGGSSASGGADAGSGSGKAGSGGSDAGSGGSKAGSGGDKAGSGGDKAGSGGGKAGSGGDKAGSGTGKAGSGGGKAGSSASKASAGAGGDDAAGGGDSPGTEKAPPESGKEKSGAKWVNRFATSRSLDDLNADFAPKAKAFVGAVQAAGGSVSIAATYRPKERAFLMHYCYLVASGELAPGDVPTMAGVDIEWNHGSAAASKAAAQAMVDGYDIAYAPALTSRHTARAAIDINVSWSGTLKIKDANGTVKELGAPRDNSNSGLHAVGASYGVNKLVADPPHWSDNGH